MNPPDRIYLQVDPEDEGLPIRYNEAVTWCADKINKTDVEYVRADLYNLDLEALEEKLDKALEGETRESLTEWIKEKRKL